LTSDRLRLRLRLGLGLVSGPIVHLHARTCCSPVTALCRGVSEIRSLSNAVQLLRPRERWRSIVMRACVCLSLCPRGYLRNHTRDRYHFLCILPMPVDRSSFAILTIGRIACRREGGDWSAQRRRSVIFDCLVLCFFCISGCFVLVNVRLAVSTGPWTACRKDMPPR